MEHPGQYLSQLATGIRVYLSVIVAAWRCTHVATTCMGSLGLGICSARPGVIQIRCVLSLSTTALVCCLDFFWICWIQIWSM